MLLSAKRMKMKTTTRRKVRSKQTKQELGKGEEENLCNKTITKQTKQELGGREEANLWRQINQ
jgi:hypothetical protein